MFGGNFGHESELRDANRRLTGRRHQPREMTSDNGVPSFYNTLAAQQHELQANYRAQQEQNANNGPSFMDKMYENSKDDGSHLIAIGVNGGHGEVLMQKGSHGNAPRDHLNLFEWDSGNANNANNKYQQQQEQQQQQLQQQQNNPHGKRLVGNIRQGRRSIPSESELRELCPPQDAETLRTQESNKFESNAQGLFLRFDEYNNGPERRTGIAVRQRGSNGKGAGVNGCNGKNINNINNVNNNIGGNSHAAYGTPEHGMMDSLIRDDGGYKRQIKRPGPQVEKKNGPPIEGFPGMGQASEHKLFSHINRKVIPSSIFPPNMDAQSGQGDNNYYGEDNNSNNNNEFYGYNDDQGQIDANGQRRSQSQRAHPQFGNEQATNAVYNYNPAKGIVPEVYQYNNNDVPLEKEKQGIAINPEWLQETQLSNYQTGIAPAPNVYVSPQSKKHIDFDKEHEQLESANPQRRTMLYKMRNQELEREPT